MKEFAMGLRFQADLPKYCPGFGVALTVGHVRNDETEPNSLRKTSAYSPTTRKLKSDITMSFDVVSILFL